MADIAEGPMTADERRELVAAIVVTERRLDELLGRFESVLGEGRAFPDDYRAARCFARSLSGHVAHLEALAAAEDRLRESETAGYIRSLNHDRAAGRG